MSREEAKLVTRHRLLEAAATLLPKAGYGGLSASAVARIAGVAQPTFYVHFKDKDELLQVLAEDKIGALRKRLREARERVRTGAGVEAVRETFRLALRTFTDYPGLFRIYVGEYYQPASPLGEQSRRLRAELVHDLAEDLVRLGIAGFDAERAQEAEMVADAMIAQTEALGFAYLEGRYSDLEAIIDVLTRFAVGILGLGQSSGRP